jgi:FAD/FMN-containing dehydrogenase
MTLPDALLRSLAGIVGKPHVLTGDATAGFAVDWTGRFQGHTPAVVRPGDTAEVAGVLALCTDAGVPVVPQGGNTGLVGGGVPRHGEVVLSLTRLNQLGPVDQDAAQVTAGAGVTLRQVADADPDLDLGILIASRGSATVGGAVATNAGGLRVLRFGPMRAQLRGIEAVLADGIVVSHLAGLVKDNTGYDYPSLLAGSEGTLAVVTQARLRLVPSLRDMVTALAGLSGLEELHALARQAVREVPGLVSAEFFTSNGLDILVAHAGLAPPLPVPAPAYLLLEASGPGALDDLADVIGDRQAAVGESAADRARLWSYRERHPEAAGFLGVPIKLDVSVPAAQWVRLASEAAAVITDVDPGAEVITFGHVADGNVHVNIVPAAPADGRHENAVFSLVASLGGSISAEHGIGALKARWLPLARTDAERALFARIRSAFDPSATLNPNVLPRLSKYCRLYAVRSRSDPAVHEKAPGCPGLGGRRAGACAGSRGLVREPGVARSAQVPAADPLGDARRRGRPRAHRSPRTQSVAAAPHQQRPRLPPSHRACRPTPGGLTVTATGS